MANYMARYRRSTSHYADVECAYVELERYLVLICNDTAPAAVRSNSKALGDARPTALPSSPIAPLSWAAVIGCRCNQMISRKVRAKLGYMLYQKCQTAKR